MLPGDWGRVGPNLMGAPKFYDTGPNIAAIPGHITIVVL